MILLAVLLAAQAEPGLVATYRSGDASVTRVEARAALNVGLESPHPRIPPGPFEVTWTGTLQVLDPEPMRFDGYAGGDVTVTFDGVEVLRGSGDLAPSAPIERKTGRYPFRVDFKSRPGVPARLQLFWASSAFTREPIPPFRLSLAADSMPAVAFLEQRGRDLAGKHGCARCHSGAFPGVDDPAPGPPLGTYDAGWVSAWLATPSHPRVFADARERQLAVRGLAPAERGQDAGDFRMGRRHFLSLGCVGCHFIPEEDAEDQAKLGRSSLVGKADRFPGTAALAAFLMAPHRRYPDGRMPDQRLDQKTATDLAAYVRKFSGPTPTEAVLRVDGDPARLLKEKRCAACHADERHDVPLRKAGECSGVGFSLSDLDRHALAAYQAVAKKDVHPSPVEGRRRLLSRLGCAQCHVLDGRRTPPLEEASSVIGGAFLQTVPFLRTPRLTDLHAKFRPAHVVATLRNGVSGDRHNRYTFRMPSFGEKAEEIARALAELEGAPWPPIEEPAPKAADPALVDAGPRLGGFEGYSCISCHLWKKELMSEADPGAIGPDLASVAGKLRREWFDRWLEDPARVHPGTPMPQVFKKGQPATLRGLFEGDAVKQREALWAWLSLGKEAPSPRPLPPIAIDAPSAGPPTAALIPIRLASGGGAVESLTILWPSNDLLVFDLASRTPRALYSGARILRTVKGRIRTYTASGTERPLPAAASLEGAYAGYELLPDGVRIRTESKSQTWTLRGRTLLRDGAPEAELPPAAAPPAIEAMTLLDSARDEGSLARPGYRAIAYPRPKTPSGDDLVMPGAIAADPRDGRVFVASMKRGEIFEVKDPSGDGVGATYEDWARGLFQEAYSMHAESGALVVLHRRNLTRISDSDGDGKADKFDRVFALPHSVVDAYDYGYGLVKEKDGAWLFSYAPYASRKLPGSGGLIRMRPGQAPEEVAYGFRNPLGWTANAEGDVFYTDNQGEWVATNKLCHIVPGRYYGFPNPEQKDHASKPRGKTAVWVPYAWARSINGVTCDTTGGRFGPFDGQIFMAELMYGGAIIRAAVERVNGEVQGACWPFWGKGLLGPVVLTFDPKGRLWVGSITEPGWMAQPDRGALYRIDFTGEAPFEMRSMHLRPRGFRVVFTRPVDPATARDPASWSLEHYRYEYTGSYGSPELDRAKVEVEKVDVAPDGLSAELRCAPIQKDRVYMVGGKGVRSAKSEPLVNPVGAYTVNEIPTE